MTLPRSSPENVYLLNFKKGLYLMAVVSLYYKPTSLILQSDCCWIFLYYHDEGPDTEIELHQSDDAKPEAEMGSRWRDFLSRFIDCAS